MPGKLTPQRFSELYQYHVTDPQRAAGIVARDYPASADQELVAKLFRVVDVAVAGMPAGLAEDRIALVKEKRRA